MSDILPLSPVPPRRSKKVVLGGVAGLVLCLGLVSGFSYANARSTDLLRHARQSIASGNYEGGLELLKRAGTFAIFRPTEREIADLQASDLRWVADNRNLAEAAGLLANGMLDEAAALLARVSKDFPDHSRLAKLTDAASTGVTAAVVPRATPTPAAPQGGSSGKRFASESALPALEAAATVAQAQAALQTFASQYGLTMQITSVAPSSYVTQYDTFSILSAQDLEALKVYGAMFIDEWSKYPADWVTNSKLKSVVLVKKLAASGTNRAAAPDPFGEAMYYDVTFSGDYAREVLHHEFDHLFTYTYFSSYAPADNTWRSYNQAGFTYGTGGASCYAPGNSCLTGEHPIPGFVTGYGASAIEEDKAELYAYLMTGTYYHHLLGWLATDPYLTAKVASYKQFIASHSPTMSGNYFDLIDP